MSARIARAHRSAGIVVTALSSLAVGLMTASALQGVLNGVVGILAYVGTIVAWVLIVGSALRDARS